MSIRLAALVAALAQVAPAPPQEGAPRYGNAPAGLEAFAGSHLRGRPLFDALLEANGALRDEPEPEGLKEVKLGIITTLTGRGSEAGRSMRDGILLALDQENQAGGMRGLPFTLIERDDHGPWGASSNELVKLTYDDEVFAVFGSSEANSIHVALRVALKVGMPMISTGCSDPTVTETGIPWVIRIFPDDRQNAYRLASFLYREQGHRTAAVVRVNDKYGRMGIGEFMEASRRLGHASPLEIRFLPGDTDFSAPIAKVKECGADCVVFLGAAEEGGRFARQLRDAGVSLPLCGSDLLVSPRFLELAGDAAEGIVLPTPIDPQRAAPPLAEFRKRFAERFGRPADAFAAYGYDGARIVAAAVRKAGLNRARIRDALFEPDRYELLAGKVELDPTRNRITPVQLTRVEHGAFVGGF